MIRVGIGGWVFEPWRGEFYPKGLPQAQELFVFSLKGPQFATNRRVLAEAGDSIERFFASGVLELKSKLGPILWQMAPTK